MAERNAQTNIGFAVLALMPGSIISDVVDAEISASDNFSVTLHDCRFGLTEQVCYVDIQNIDTTSHEFNLSVIVSNTSSFEECATQMQISEWKGINSTVHDYETIDLNEMYEYG